MVKRTKSSEHAAVRIYREKLASIQDGVAQSISELDKNLSEYLEEITIRPPPNREGTDK